MSAGFTPGPWECEPESERPRPWVGRLAENRFAAMACGEDEAEAWANGRLIAAAPALYEALANMVECFAKRGGTWDELLGSSEQCEQVNDAMSALKLARGEEA